MNKYLLKVINSVESIPILPDIPTDKKLHFLSCLVVGGVSQYFTSDYFTSCAVVFATGMVKEGWDEYSYGGFSHKDNFANWIGGLVGIGSVGLLQMLF